MRAVAAFTVVAFHVWLPGFAGGFIGVDVFFVLSGYLITTLLVGEIERTGTIAVRAFWWRRLVRLLPAMLLMLACVALVMPALFPDHAVLTEMLFSGFYISNLTHVLLDLPQVTGHTWSLAMEMQFYLLWPLIILGLVRFAPRQTTAVLLALFVAVTLWRWWVYDPQDSLRAYFGPDTRGTGLILGAALATSRWRPPVGSEAVLAAAALVVLGICVLALRYYTEPASSWAGSLVEIAAAVVVASLAAGRGWIAGFLASPLMVRLGTWSYGIYLWHYPIARVARSVLEPIWAFGVTAVLSVTLAALSYALIERPLRRLLTAPRRTVLSSDAHPQRHPAT